MPNENENGGNVFTVNLCSQSPDAYLTDPYFSYYYRETNINGIISVENTASFQRTAPNNTRMAFYPVETNPLWSEGELTPKNKALQAALTPSYDAFTIFLQGVCSFYDENGTFSYSESYTDSPLGVGRTGDFSGHVGTPRYPKFGALTIDTNIPFFSTAEEAQAYVNSGTGLDMALNFTTKLPGDYAHDYYIYNSYSTSQPDLQGGIKKETGSASNFLQFNPSDTKIALYQTSPSVGNPFNLRLVGGGSGLFSTDGEAYFPFDSPPVSDFINKMIVTGGVQYNITLFETNIPIFSTSSEADGYLHNTTPLSDAVNYNDIVGDGAAPNFGTDMESTDLPVNYLKSHLMSVYGLNSTSLSEISGKLFTTDGSLKEQILEGLSLFGYNPIDFVSGLLYFPFNVLDVCQSSQQSYIMFGGYHCDLNATINKIGYNNILKDIGSFTYTPTYNDFRDYEPHTMFYIYLPYIGTQQLNISKYIGKSVNIKYGIDVNSGACNAYIFADNLLQDTFSGQIGIKLPVTGTANASWSGAMLSKLTNTVTGGLSASMPITQQSAPKEVAVLGQATASEITTNAGGLALVGTKMAANAATSISGLYSSTAIPVRSGGSPVPNIEKFSPQYPYAIFASQESIEPKNLRQNWGKPDNTITTLSKYKGYVLCDMVNLKTSATAKERADIESQLLGGIYI